MPTKRKSSSRARYVIHPATSREISEVIGAPRTADKIVHDIIEKRKKADHRKAKRRCA